MKCSKCTEKFDVACISMTREYFEGIKEDKKSVWLCPTCVCSQPKGDNSSTPVRSLDPVKCVKQSNSRDVAGDCNVNVTRGGRNVNKPKNTALPSSNPQIDITNQLLDLRKYFDSKLDSIKKDILDEFTEKLNVFEQSVEHIKRQQDTFDTRMDSLVTTLSNMKTEHDSNCQAVARLSQEFSSLLTRVTTLENENTQLRSNISDLESLQQNINDVEQRGRLNNLEIFGIAERKTEALVPLICKIGSVLGVTVTGEDVDYATRIPSRVKTNGLPKAIIVKFKSIQLRDSLLSAVRKRRGLASTDIGIPGESKPIYINEHLTARNKALLKATRIKCKELGFQNVWTRNAKIYVRQHNKAPAIRIFKIDQMDNVKK